MVLFFLLSWSKTGVGHSNSAKQADWALSRVVLLQSIILVNKNIRVRPMHGKQCASFSQKHVKQGPQKIEALKKFCIFFHELCNTKSDFSLCILEFSCPDTKVERECLCQPTFRFYLNRYSQAYYIYTIYT